MVDRAAVERIIDQENGLLRLRPAWVARNFLPPGRRLGLPEKEYALGNRGGICERWLASTTEADNAIKVPHEGLSFVKSSAGIELSLRDAVATAPETILGAAYAQAHPRGLDRLAKLFDYKYRLPFHLHQMKHHAALVGRNPKEEAYYFPEGVDLGLEPETYLGVHPSIVEDNQQEALLPPMVSWDSDAILQHSRAYKLIPGDGWHIPAGILHGPGSALTIELQEDSDVFAMMQAKVGGRIISKELLFKDVRPEDRKRLGERAILEMVDWEANGDHYFYENHHTPPLEISGSRQESGREYWIFYNTLKFSGKKLVVRPAGNFKSRDKGVYSIFVWSGQGVIDGVRLAGGDPEMDELLVCEAKATSSMDIRNTGRDELVLFKFFGPDVNPDVPFLQKRSLRA